MADLERRFGGVGRLYGEEAAERLRAAHVCVIGIGGVGSWAAEALARTAVGQITLVDLDIVAESNTNRQLHAVEENFGKAKVQAMAERILAINPKCKVTCIDDFLTVENVAVLISSQFDFVVDAIDQVRAKTALIAHCKRSAMPIVVCGAAGGQIDPTRITNTDLSLTTQDPLLAKVRSSLRREFDFPRGNGKKFGVVAIYSTEPLRYPDKSSSCELGRAPQGINCAGFGSTVCVTAVFGMLAASVVINHLAVEKRFVQQRSQL